MHTLVLLSLLSRDDVSAAVTAEIERPQRSTWQIAVAQTSPELVCWNTEILDIYIYSSIPF